MYRVCYKCGYFYDDAENPQCPQCGNKDIENELKTDKSSKKIDSDTPTNHKDYGDIQDEEIQKYSESINDEKNDKAYDILGDSTKAVNINDLNEQRLTDDQIFKNKLNDNTFSENLTNSDNEYSDIDSKTASNLRDLKKTTVIALGIILALLVAVIIVIVVN